MPNPAAEVVEVFFGGRTFRCSRRTYAHLLATQEHLTERGLWLRVIQGCYNTGVEASAGTHDYDAVLDVEVVGLTWSAAQRLLRELGWAAWWRTPAQGFSNHIHMVSLGYPGRVGVFVPGQVDDYYRHAFGLKGQHDSGSDPSWFPPDIDSTILDYDSWLEAHMPLNEADLEKVRAVVREEMDAADDRIKYQSPSGQQVSRRRFFEAWRKGQDKK